MSGFRQRNFDGNPTSREDLNLTKYDEKYTYPTEPAAGPVQQSMFQSPVQQAAPDLAEQSYVFGRRDSVDGRARVFGNPGASVPTQNSTFGTPSQSMPYSAPAQSSPFGAPSSGSAFGATPIQPAVESERPMVFMLRDDNNMFVYEYSDRLEYYRRTEVGMVHCATKFKAKTF
ncbi:MAG: hypothetical protein J1G38_04890 [Clostridiales bacterium]|nr:hypothetical protein [Clostridiales bacterium]